MAERVERRLAAILAADVAGYSRLIGEDEEGTLAALRTVRREVIDPKIAEHRGRIVKTTGDGLLAEFASVVDALRCASAWQAAMPGDSKLAWRIGVHQGDIVVEDGDIFGDGVNVASRLEGIAEPGGICVSARVQEDTAGRLDLGFEDIGEQSLKNIARPVRVYRVTLTRRRASPSGTLSRSAGEGLVAGALKSSPAPREREGPVVERREGEGQPALALPDKPSIAVLPFQNMSGDPGQDYFADGMVEEITTAIARLPWLFVIARNSAFTYKGTSVDVKRVARELGVRYVLEGSVRKAGSRVRITGQLIDTATGAHIWADRFDSALDDIFELQDQVASSVAGAIEPRLRLSEIERAVRKPTENLGAYDLYLRAVGAMYKDVVSPQCIEFAQRALAVQPDYVAAAAVIATVRSNQLTLGGSPTEAEIAEALDFARSAVETSSEDADTLARGANALAFLGGGHATAMRAIERALALNPSCAYAWGIAARVHCLANHPDAAIAAAERAMRLSPLDPFHFSFEWALGWGLMLAGRYEEAVEWVDRCLHDRPGYHSGIRGRVALCGYLGQVEEAREWVKRLPDRDPATTIAAWMAYAGRFTSAGTLAVWVEGFRRAGLPEG